MIVETTQSAKSELPDSRRSSSLEAQFSRLIAKSNSNPASEFRELVSSDEMLSQNPLLLSLAVELDSSFKRRIELAKRSIAVDTAGAQNYSGIGKSSLISYRTHGGGPIYAKLAGRCLYLLSDLDDFLRSKRVTSTAEAAARGVKAATRPDLKGVPQVPKGQKRTATPVPNLFD